MKLLFFILGVRPMARGGLPSERGELRGMLSTRVSTEQVNKPTDVVVPFMACLETAAECNTALTLQ